MKAKDLKWLVGMIPDDAEVIIGGNRFAEVVAVDCDDYVDRLGERAYNLVLTEGWSITKDAELDAMEKQLRQLIEGYQEPAVAINTWQDLQSVYVVTKRHLLVYDNCQIEQFPSSTEELFTEILNAIKGGERYE